MQVTIQGEVLTITSFAPFRKSRLLYTEGANGIVKVFLWYIGSCKLIARYNKNSVAEIEYIENQLKEWSEKRHDI